jgi:uncharacterized protein (TIGR02246 family)
MTNAEYAAEIERIRQIREAMEQAEKELDVAAVVELFAENVAMMPEGGPELSGLEAVAAFHRDFYDGLEEFDINFTAEDTTVQSTIAMEKGTYEATLVAKEDGEAQDVSGRYLYFYEQDEDGEWKILRMSW